LFKVLIGWADALHRAAFSWSRVMKRLTCNLALAALFLPGAAVAASDAPADVAWDFVAWDFVAGLTSEVGQRLAGSEAEARGRVWAAEKLKALGFKGVVIEPASTRAYVRGIDMAKLVSPVPQLLAFPPAMKPVRQPNAAPPKAPPPAPMSWSLPCWVAQPANRLGHSASAISVFLQCVVFIISPLCYQ
jgi:hypothetical protein